MNYENILVETQEKIGLIRLNRPKALNALNDQLMDELGDAMLKFDADDKIGCIVITGRNGQVRIKGSDLSVDGSTKPGTLRLDHSQILATGETVDLRALGTPIGVNPRWNHNAAGYIYAAHIKGFNGSIDVKWLNHSNVGLFSFFGAIYDPLPRDGRDTHFTNFHFIVQSLGSDYSQEGDSGGGVFFEGALIGVTLAANVLDAPIGRNSVRFVVLQ